MRLTLAAVLLFPVLVPSAPRGEDILSAVARNSALRHAVPYSGRREYSIKNLRFSKSAAATVRVQSEPGRGKDFTLASQSGSTKLIGIIETLLSSEADASRPAQTGDHEIGPANYRAEVKGTEKIDGHDCWVLTLTPKTRDRYLVKGTAWVDKTAFWIVRLDGITAASVSWMVGTPHIVEDFAPVGGIWLPVHTVAKSSSFLLGESDLDIRYVDYHVDSGKLSLSKNRADAGWNSRVAVGAF